MSVINQNDRPTLYCLVNPNEENVDVRFMVFGTGWELPELIDNLEFIDTVSTFDGTYIWHIFRDR